MSEPRPLPSGPLHFVGIGGAGMSAIALVLAGRGQRVSGSDPGISDAVSARLTAAGIAVACGPHNAGHVPEDCAALIVTDAVKGENPEVSEAQRRNLPIFKRGEALGAIVNAAKTSICVAGTHGKTTTTGMIASILLAAGRNPTVLIGGDLPQIQSNARAGDPDLVVAEACEAYGGLDWLKPGIAVVLNMEPDHLDFHGSEENFNRAFRNFGRRIKPQGVLVITAQPDLIRLAQTITADGDPARVIACGTAPEISDILADEIEFGPDGTTFRASVQDSAAHSSGKFRVAVPGEHNLKNALVAIGATYRVFGEFSQKRFAGIESFTGTGRRFERLGETGGGVTVIDDYAHHPTEIRATMQAARQAFPDRRIVAIFQPHLPSRTQDFFEAFADALSRGGADCVYLTDIYLAREPERPGLIEALAEKTCRARLVKNRQELPQALHAELRAGDVAVFMGAGNIREQAEAFLSQA